MFNIAIVGLGFGSEFIPIYQKHTDVNLYAIYQRNKENIVKVKTAAFLFLTDLFLILKWLRLQYLKQKYEVK